MLLYFIQGFSIGFSAAATPGPLQTFMIGRALKNGWRQTLPAVVAPLIADGPIIFVMVILLNNASPLFLRLIRIAGGIYIFFLAWKSFQMYRNFQQVKTLNETRKTLWQAVLTIFLSPGPYIFWSMLAGPVLVQGWRETPANGLAFLVGFYFAMIGCMALLVVLFSSVRQLGTKIQRALIGISALVMAAFGIYQLWQGLI